MSASYLVCLIGSSCLICRSRMIRSLSSSIRNRGNKNMCQLLPPAIHIFRDQDPKNRMVAEGRICPKKCNPVFKRNYQSVETSWTQESLKSSVIHCVGTTFVWPYVGSHIMVGTISTTYPTHFSRTGSGPWVRPTDVVRSPNDYYLPISF